MINRLIQYVSFIIASIIFVMAAKIVYANWNNTFMSISSFASLEYCGLYAYTIYDHIKSLK
jgi:hypothetical protein